MFEDMRFVRRAGPSLFVSRPNSVQFGHLGMEMVMALARARAAGAAIAFLRDRHVVNEAAFDLESDQVKIRKLSSPEEAWWRLRWSLVRTRDAIEAWNEEWREDFWDEFGRLLREETWKADLSPRLRDALRSLKNRTGRHRPAGRMPATPYLKRRLIRTAVPVQLRPEVLQRTEAAAAALGIAPDAPIVTIHAREPGWKRGREVQDKIVRGRGQRPRDDSTRNVRIETYFPAIDYLISRGFTVVRLGDPSMKPVARRGVVDLALEPRRTPALDLHCLLRSSFLLAGESGPSVFTLLTNTPTLTVNATDPVSSFPIRANWLFVLKKVIDLQTGEQLSLSQMASEGYLGALRDTYRFRFMSNTREEILEAVQEMLAFLNSPPPESPRQVRFREQVTRSSIDLGQRYRYVRKWAADDEFLGDGRIAQFYVDRHLD